MQKLWDTKHAAEHLGVSKAKLCKARMAGASGPPFVKIGRHVRYVPEQVEQWVQHQQAK